MPRQRLADIIELSDRLDLAIFILGVAAPETLVFAKINRFYEQATGLANADLAGRTPFEALPQRAAHSANARFLTCLRSGQPYTYEEAVDLPNGEMWWQTTLSPLLDEQGSVLAIVGTSTDMTARKLQEFRDTKAMADLRQLNEEVNMYASMAAHDVRGPLRKIKVISELVLEDGAVPDGGPVMAEDERRALIEAVGALATTTLAHVDSILSYARALTLPDQAVLEVLDLALLFDDLVNLVDAHGAFDIVYPTVTICAERVVLQITLRNLLENAVKYGRSACRVALDVSPHDERQLMFTVSDDGPGFGDGAVLGEQSAQTRLRSPVSGFGLSSAQRIIETRGGKMWLAPPCAGLGDGVGGSVAFTTRGSIVEPGTMGAP